MPKHKVYEDRHSPYIKFNGSYYRPVEARYVIVAPARNIEHLSIYKGPVAHNGQLLYVDGLTNAEVGSKADVRDVRSSPYCIVNGELWTTHGSHSKWDKNLKKMVVNPSEEKFYHGQIYQPESDM